MSTQSPPELTQEQVWDIISPLKKRNWYDKTRPIVMKTSTEWGNLYKALCYVGIKHDNRYPKKMSLKQLIIAKDFCHRQDQSGFHFTRFTRGENQAYQYRCNRMHENAHRFTNHIEYDNYDFKLDFIYIVFKSRTYDREKIGYVIASSAEDANQIAKMLYAPFFSNLPAVKISVGSDYSVPIIDNDQSVFFELMSKVSMKNLATKQSLYDQIDLLKAKIDISDLVADCINLNMCAYESNNS